jgi:phosphoenolpyruvate synthase/pyruvate phosphate dikinase
MRIQVLTSSHSESTIKGPYGLGEPIVLGAVTPDEHCVSK